MAGDRPPPYVRGRRFFTAARGPVPRDRWIARGMARDRPSPYDEGRLSAAAAPVGAPLYCIETRRSLLPGTSLALRPGGLSYGKVGVETRRVCIETGKMRRFLFPEIFDSPA